MKIDKRISIRLDYVWKFFTALIVFCIMLWLLISASAFDPAPGGTIHVIRFAQKNSTFLEKNTFSKSDLNLLLNSDLPPQFLAQFNWSVPGEFPYEMIIFTEKISPFDPFRIRSREIIILNVKTLSMLSFENQDNIDYSIKYIKRR